MTKWVHGDYAARVRRFAFCTPAILWIGCKVGPDYQPPNIQVPGAWSELVASESVTNQEAGPSVATAAPMTLANWWSTFHDSTLDQLIQRAVQANWNLRRAEARVREARARRGVAAADLDPTLNASGSYTRNRPSTNVFGASPGNAGNQVQGYDLYQVGFDAAWELDVFGGVRRNIEAADADVAAGIEDRRDVLVSLLAEVARNYVELRGAQREAAIARENLAAQRGTVDLTRLRFEAGLASALDIARAEAQAQTTAAQIPSLEASGRRSIHVLSVLLARDPLDLAAELEREAPIPVVPLEIPVGLPSDLLRRRPDVRRAERQLAAATARIGVATADLFPRFSLTGALGLQSSRSSTLADADSRYGFIGPSVNWRLFDFGRARNGVEVQNAREEQAADAYEQTVLTSLREVEDALVTFSKEQSRRRTLALAVEANVRAADLADQLHQQGRTDFLSVLQAQRDLYAAQDALVQSERNVSSDLVALYKALGGGWEIESFATASDSQDQVDVHDEPVRSP